MHGSNEGRDASRFWTGVLGFLLRSVGFPFPSELVYCRLYAGGGARGHTCAINYGNLAYSAWACFRIGRSGSASFHCANRS